MFEIISAEVSLSTGYFENSLLTTKSKQANCNLAPRLLFSVVSVRGVNWCDAQALLPVKIFSMIKLDLLR